MKTEQKLIVQVKRVLFADKLKEETMTRRLKHSSISTMQTKTEAGTYLRIKIEIISHVHIIRPDFIISFIIIILFFVHVSLADANFRSHLPKLVEYALRKDREIEKINK